MNSKVTSTSAIIVASNEVQSSSSPIKSIENNRHQAIAIKGKKLQNQRNSAIAAKREFQPRVVQTTLNVGPMKPPNTNAAGTTKRKSDQTRTPTDSESFNSPVSIRLTVQKMLREQLTLRMDETSKYPKLSDDQINEFAIDTERELYLLNRDTSSKYRAKYCSLMFNIKDRKNKTLFRKICDKRIQPKQLVRMSPEDLASQELAQWRKNENKHQFEMIKNTELDLLAFPMNYVIKTHKGEEVIESKTSDRVSLDPSTSVRDLVSVLNNSAVSSTSDIDEVLHSPAKRSRSRSREREQLNAKKCSSSESKHTRKRSVDKNHQSGDKDKVDPSKIHKTDTPKQTSDRTASKDPSKLLKKSEKCNLTDKILEAQSIIDSILRSEEIAKKEMVAETKTSVIPPAADGSLSDTLISHESDQKPTSSVTILTTPENFYQQSMSLSPTSDINYEPLWSGNIFMVNVAVFQIEIRPLSGDFSDIFDDLPVELNVIGRIEPDAVWEYIAKIKKSPYKEVLVFRCDVAIDKDSAAYEILYTHLTFQQRFGVIKTTSSALKNIYVLPLSAHSSLPSVLLPIDCAGYYNDRPDLLIGIIVRNRSMPFKRALSTPYWSDLSRRAFGERRPSIL